MNNANATRRTVLAAAAVTLLPALAGANRAPPDAAAWRNALTKATASLNGPGLLQSYTVGGTTDFDHIHENCAYTYDNAAAGLALLAIGEREGARRIAAALAYAQENDRFYHDGRLRNAYRAGPALKSGAMPLNGWWDNGAQSWREDAYQAGTATGPLAWAMLLWSACDPEFRKNADHAADFIEANLLAPQGFHGGFFGFEPAPQKLPWISTEHNTDLAAAFGNIGRMQSAAHARDFVSAMWQENSNSFAMGLRPDGSLNPASALDANLWPPLLPNASPAWREAFASVLQTHGLPNEAGVDFTTARTGIWLEGTAYVALLAQRSGNAPLAQRSFATLQANTAPNGQIYATTVPTLATGLAIAPQSTQADFLYYRRPHLAATSWAILAAASRNPFTKTAS